MCLKILFVQNIYLRAVSDDVYIRNEPELIRNKNRKNFFLVHKMSCIRWLELVDEAIVL